MNESLLAIMRSPVVLCLAFCFALFGFGHTLNCYSCPDGTADGCENSQECNQGDDSCLSLTSAGKIHSHCMRYADCSFSALAVRYPPPLTFSCCQSNLCNSSKKGMFQRFLDFFG
ncbi:CD59 glycoprotein-like [Genypterus blacodes]|uniref:CD59 glycoprotein-like n=1 Tax=Genypterus blacodes TaxID=154954 RepID=UPI003F76AE34